MIIEVIIIFLMWLCMLTRNNKVLFALFSGIMILLMVYTTDRADYIAYIGRYAMSSDVSRIFDTDFGFGFLMYVCKSSGLTFDLFLGVLGCLALSLVFYTYNKYSAICCVHLVFYFILMFGQHMIQIRSFLAEWIVVVALLSFLGKGGKTVQYVLTVLFAGSFHYTSFFYLCMLIPKFVKKTYIIAFITAGIVLVFRVLYGILNNFFSASSFMRLEPYLRGTNERFGISAIIFIVLLIILTLFSAYLSYHCFRKGLNEDSEKFDLLTRFNIMGWVSIGLVIIYNNNFYRLSRPMILVTTLYIINHYLEKRHINYHRNTVLLSVAFIMLYIVSELALPHTWYEAIQNNSLFQYLGLI